MDLVGKVQGCKRWWTKLSLRNGTFQCFALQPSQTGSWGLWYSFSSQSWGMARASALALWSGSPLCEWQLNTVRTHSASLKESHKSAPSQCLWHWKVFSGGDKNEGPWGSCRDPMEGPSHNRGNSFAGQQGVLRVLRKVLAGSHLEEFVSRLPSLRHKLSLFTLSFPLSASSKQKLKINTSS